jgi:hemolysin III
MRKIFKDPISGLTHLLGAVLGAFGLVYLVTRGARIGSPWAIVSCSIFGASLILLYSSSAIYHLLHVSEKRQQFFRRLDHTMIFVLIAGSYTPFCLMPLRGPWGWTLLAVVWMLALGGFLMKLVWLDAPRWLSTGLYLFMGWIVVFAIYPLMMTVRPSGLLWLAAGGLLYSFGAVIYAIKKPDPFPEWFGFHEIWHLFVLAGSISHFVSVTTLI